MNRLFLFLFGGAVCVMPMSSSALAQDAAPEGDAAAPAPPGHRVHVQRPEDVPNFGRLGFDGGVDVSHAYYFRGYLQEDRGVIVQPFFNMYFLAVEEENLSVTPFLGTWNSFHSRKTDTVGTNQQWYESDLYGGVDVTIDDWTLHLVYTFYTYPNGAADTIQEVGAVLSYDDSALAERLGLPFAFNPYVGVYYEVAGSYNGYLELGIEPSITQRIAGRDVDFSFPVTFGASIDDYYLNRRGRDTFAGYLSAGVTASVPLPIDTAWGEWRLNAGVHWLHLFAHSAREANRGDANEIIGNVGISFSY